jgi:hypothetical protein
LVLVAFSTSAAPAQASAATSNPVQAARLAKKNCTPGYSPCIPNKPSDVDCWGGNGNGPRYTAPHTTYTVKKGSDRYGLDSDKDGLGCEPYGR